MRFQGVSTNGRTRNFRPATHRWFCVRCGSVAARPGDGVLDPRNASALVQLAGIEGSRHPRQHENADGGAAGALFGAADDTRIPVLSVTHRGSRVSKTVKPSFR